MVILYIFDVEHNIVIINIYNITGSVTVIINESKGTRDNFRGATINFIVAVI